MPRFGAKPLADTRHERRLIDSETCGCFVYWMPGFAGMPPRWLPTGRHQYPPRVFWPDLCLSLHIIVFTGRTAMLYRRWVLAVGLLAALATTIGAAQAFD